MKQEDSSSDSSNHWPKKKEIKEVAGLNGTESKGPFFAPQPEHGQPPGKTFLESISVPTLR